MVDNRSGPDTGDTASVAGMPLPPSPARRATPGSATVRDHPLSRVAYSLFIALIITNLINLPNRIPGLGYARPTLLLISATTVLLFMSKDSRPRVTPSNTSRLLLILIGYVLIAIPFAEWPGSALGTGVEGLLKAIVFFFFPLYLVNTYRRLKQLILVVVTCQIVRILEPLYLHIATGYWGSQAHIGGGEFMDRLAGAPNDTINPNGLAFVIMTVLPFLHYLLGGSRRPVFKIAYVLFLPPLLYTLLLTGSRSGMVGLVVVYLFIIVRSRRPVPLIFGAVIAVAIMLPVMDANLKDRYLSLVSDNTRNAGTREGRVSGVIREFEIGMRRPIFGYGIGTSREANANFGGVDQMSHDLYTEVFIELGAVGLIIFLGVLFSIVRTVLGVRPAIRRIWMLAREMHAVSRTLRVRLHYYQRCAEALFVFTMMCMVFSLASYGLSEFYWYLTAGMAVSLLNVVWSDSEHIVAMTRSAMPTGIATAPLPTG